jgi:integrase
METETTTSKPTRTRGSGCIFCRYGCDVSEKACGHPLWLKWSVNGKARKCASGTRNKHKAESMLAQKIAETRTGQYMGPKAERTMVAELAEDLFRDYQINGKRSLDAVERRWKKHLKPFFGLLKASEVTKDVVKRYVDQRQRQGASNASINREMAALKRMFNLGKGDKVAQIPVFPHLRENNIRTGFVDDHDYDKLAAACTKQGLWMRGLFETAYRLGWRKEELLNLRVGQVDLLNRVVRLEPGQTKNGRGRTAPIDNTLYVWLQQCVIGKDSDRYVFSRDSLGVRPICDCRDAWYEVCCEGGVGRMLCRVCSTPIVSGNCSTCQQERTSKEQVYEGLILHDLRRTAIRNMVRAGIPEKISMTISGHETRSIFDRYDIGSASDLEIARQRMNSRTVPITVHSDTETAPSELQSLTQVQDDLPN